MRRDASKAADYAKRHNVPRWYADADQLINDAEVDAVYIATPPNAHEEYALKVCAAGKPCYVEKPMARNVAEARRMCDAFTKANLPLYVAYYRRALPRFVKVKSLIDSGALGAIHEMTYVYKSDGQKFGTAQTPWRLSAEIAGGGLFLDLGSHAIDLMDFFFGSFDRDAGKALNQRKAYPVEDHVQLGFHAGPMKGAASWDFASDTRVDEYHIMGSAGDLRFSCFGNEPVKLQRTDGSREEFNLPNPPHVQQPLIQSVVDDLRGVSSTKLSTGETALRTQRVMDDALRSYYGNRDDGFWERFRA